MPSLPPCGRPPARLAGHTVLLLQLLALTGARREEIGGAAVVAKSTATRSSCWARGQRTVSHTPSHCRPHGRGHHRQSCRGSRGAPLSLPPTGKTPVDRWSRAKISLNEAAARMNNGRALPDWRIHDLRRTVATGLQRLGIGLQVVEAVLGHISGSRAGIVGIYQRHTFDAEKKAALEAWARHVDAIVSGKGERHSDSAGGAVMDRAEISLPQGNGQGKNSSGISTPDRSRRNGGWRSRAGEMRCLGRRRLTLKTGRTTVKVLARRFWNESKVSELIGDARHGQPAAHQAVCEIIAEHIEQQNSAAGLFA